MEDIGEIQPLNPYKNIWMKTSKTIDALLIHGLDKRLVNLNFLISGLVTVLLNYNHPCWIHVLSLVMFYVCFFMIPQQF